MWSGVIGGDWMNFQDCVSALELFDIVLKNGFDADITFRRDFMDKENIRGKLAIRNVADTVSLQKLLGVPIEKSVSSNKTEMYGDANIKFDGSNMHVDIWPQGKVFKGCKLESTKEWVAPKEGHFKDTFRVVCGTEIKEEQQPPS